MKNLQIKIFAAIIVAILAGGAIYYLKSKPDIGYFPNLKQLGQKFSGSVNPIAENQKISESQNVYKNSQYGFSFSYPEGFNISDFDEGVGKVILIKKAASDNGFQIFIAAFDEPFDPAQGKPGPITKERILKDIPDMIINGEQYIDIGGERALSFTSQDDLGLPAQAGGETREIWMVYGGYLYQIKGYKNFEEKMMEILKTWKFQ